MVIGYLDDIESSLLPTRLQALLANDFFSHQHLLSLADGKYEVHQDQVFVLISSPSTKAYDECRSEFHEHYIDIQILLSGEEMIGCGPLVATEHGVTPTHPDLFFTDEPALTQHLSLRAGMFASFYPRELHRPLCQVNVPMPIKKAVVKIHRQWLAAADHQL